MLNRGWLHSEESLVDLLLVQQCTGFVWHPEEFPSGYKERGLAVPHFDHRPRWLVILIVNGLQGVPRLPLYPWYRIYVRGGLHRPCLLGVLFHIIQLWILCFLKVHHMSCSGLRSMCVRIRWLIVTGEFREGVHVRLDDCRHCVVGIPRNLMCQVRVKVVLVLEEGRMRHCHLLG